MNSLQEHLRETIDAINNITESDPDTLLNVKKIRIYYGVKASNRAKINYYWRSLRFLKQIGILEAVKSNGTKQYRLNNNIEGYYSEIFSRAKT